MTGIWQPGGYPLPRHLCRGSWSRTKHTRPRHRLRKSTRLVWPESRWILKEIFCIRIVSSILCKSVIGRPHPKIFSHNVKMTRIGRSGGYPLPRHLCRGSWSRTKHTRPRHRLRKSTRLVWPESKKNYPKSKHLYLKSKLELDPLM